MKPLQTEMLFVIIFQIYEDASFLDLGFFEVTADKFHKHKLAPYLQHCTMNFEIELQNLDPAKNLTGFQWKTQIFPER